MAKNYAYSDYDGRHNMGAEAKIIQSGGRPTDPHIPHNMPGGKVGKPEGLSGSQTERLKWFMIRGL